MKNLRLTKLTYIKWKRCSTNSLSPNNSNKVLQVYLVSITPHLWLKISTIETNGKNIFNVSSSSDNEGEDTEVEERSTKIKQLGDQITTLEVRVRKRSSDSHCLLTPCKIHQCCCAVLQGCLESVGGNKYSLLSSFSIYFPTAITGVYIQYSFMFMSMWVQINWLSCANQGDSKSSLSISNPIPIPTADIINHRHHRKFRSCEGCGTPHCGNLWTTAERSWRHDERNEILWGKTFADAGKLETGAASTIIRISEPTHSCDKNLWSLYAKKQSKNLVQHLAINTRRPGEMEAEFVPNSQREGMQGFQGSSLQCLLINSTIQLDWPAWKKIYFLMPFFVRFVLMSEDFNLRR